ncbi:MAG: hypothetical protein A2Z25_22510 [Planctomycetes bacterium RBG_16_55_9]|nr:MAG: hypothetical protein A2Z25_22510 [Planctomycetes bacterium RBG_16_55_9]
MKHYIQITCVLAIMSHFCASDLHAHAGPFDGKNVTGRIAFSSDGNCNDEDDWGAFPVAVAILDAFGLTGKLVHVDYCNIMPRNDPRFYKEMVDSVQGSAKRYNVPRSIMFDCQKDLDGAVESIKNAINASSAGNPLYYVLAGPMEVPLLGIRKSQPDKRKYVYCISHSIWNDGFPQREKEHLHRFSKRDVIESGINWVQVKPGSGLTNSTRTSSTPEQWALYHWMRDSKDPRLGWIYSRLEVEGRCDVSDATMTYFLVMGDEEATPAKLKAVLDDKRLPAPVDPRRQVRIETENFRTFENFQIDNRNDRNASHRLSVKQSKAGPGRIRTLFDQPYAAAKGLYDVEVSYFADNAAGSELKLCVNGDQKGRSWTTSANTNGWQSETLANVAVNTGDEIMVEVRADTGQAARLDYVQLNYIARSSGTAGSQTITSPLDDPDALPGQVIGAGSNPGYLKYNGGGPVFLCGPDNPETFLFLGDLNPDGTRSNGEQQQVINRIIKSGANAFHFQMTRLRRCNIKDEGDDQHSPFIDFDPSRPLNEAVLDQWDGWISQFEKAGVIIHLEFYNDATDVETMGWTLDANGNLHPDEKRFFEGIVKRFKHHKNIIWGIEESVNKLPRARTPHFMKLSELIAQVDNYHHPIVHSFVTPETSEKDIGKDSVMSDEYIKDPNIRLVTWLHVLPHGSDYEAQHQAYLKYRKIDSDRFIVMKNETEQFPRTEPQSRIYQWSCAMTGMHALEAGHDVLRRQNLLAADGHIARFMEQTEFNRMKSRDDLAAGSTRWVLAKPGESYIAYTYDCSGPMGVKDMTAGTYDLKWFDTVGGDLVSQTGVSVPSGDVTWSKPDSISKEVALYIKRQ